MLSEETILKQLKKRPKITTKEIAEHFNVSRQYANSLIRVLVVANKLIKIGSTRKAFYVLPKYAQKHPELFPTKFTQILLKDPESPPTLNLAFFFP